MQASGDLYLLRRDGTRHALVFGLSWFALVGSHIAPMARVRARQMKATHYVAGGLRAAAGGCGRIGRRARRDELYAAGQAYAHLYPDGAVASIALLPDGRHWLIAAQDGAVMSRADRLYATRPQAEQALQALREQRPGLRVHDGDQALAALMRNVDPAARLAAVDPPWRRLPWPVRIFALGLVGAALLPQAWRPGGAGPGSASPVEADPRAAWRQAEQDWRRSVAVHGPQALRDVVQSLYGVPLAVHGWTLQRAQCSVGAGAWQCAAHFLRTWPGATHAVLAAAAPAAWQAEFLALDQSVLRWQVPVAGRTLAGQPLAAGAHQAFLGGLQQVAQAFSNVQVGPPVSIGPPAPRDAQGMPLPAPVDAVRLRSRTLSVSGPLRSFGVLALHQAAATWNSLTLRLEPGRAAGLSASVLVAQLQGVLYEAQ